MEQFYVAQVSLGEFGERFGLYEEPLTFEEVERCLADAGCSEVRWNGERTVGVTVGPEGDEQFIHLTPVKGQRRGGPVTRAECQVAERLLREATGRAYTVSEWAGYEPTEGEEPWGEPVYASSPDGEGDAVADADVEGWEVWLVEQAREVVR